MEQKRTAIFIAAQFPTPHSQPNSGLGTRRVWRRLGEGSLLFRTMDFAFELILFLFYRKKEKQKKLAAADKYAKILSSSLDKNKLVSLR